MDERRIQSEHETQDRPRIEEEALVEDASEILATVFDSLADGFFVLDAQWRFRYLNARAEYFLQHGRTELLGKSMWDVFPEAIGGVFHQQFHRAVEDNEAVSFEEYYPPHEMWASVHALPTPAGLTVYLSDITSRKKTEAALARSESQLRAFIDNSPDVVYIKDLEGRFLRVNEEFARRFDKVREDVVGNDDFSLLDNETAREVRANDALVLKSGLPGQFEEEIRMPDGHTVVYLSTKFPLKDTSGRVYAVAGISTDINERIRHARELAASEQRFRKVFAEGPLGIALLDPNLVFRQVNERYASLLGYSNAELAGRTLSEITHEDDRELTSALARQLLRGEIPSYHIEQRFQRSDGSAFWASVHGTLLRDDEGRPESLMSLVEDITQRKSAEEALRIKDQQIREAYSEVLGAVTGGKIVLMTSDEIGGALGEPVSERWVLEDYSALADVRHGLAQTLVRLGLDSEAIDSAVLAACEAFTNAVKHAGGGEVRAYLRDDTLQICVNDHGPGINFEHLPRATLLAGFSTSQTLGAGFTIMLEICDRLLLSTQKGLTVVVLEISLAPDSGARREERFALAHGEYPLGD